MVTQEDWLATPYPVSSRKAMFRHPTSKYIERIYAPLEPDSTFDDDVEIDFMFPE